MIQLFMAFHHRGLWPDSDTDCQYRSFFFGCLLTHAIKRLGGIKLTDTIMTYSKTASILNLQSFIYEGNIASFYLCLRKFVLGKIKMEGLHDAFELKCMIKQIYCDPLASSLKMCTLLHTTSVDWSNLRYNGLIQKQCTHCYWGNRVAMVQLLVWAKLHVRPPSPINPNINYSNTSFRPMSNEIGAKISEIIQAGPDAESDFIPLWDHERGVLTRAFFLRDDDNEDWLLNQF